MSAESPLSGVIDPDGSSVVPVSGAASTTTASATLVSSSTSSSSATGFLSRSAGNAHGHPGSLPTTSTSTIATSATTTTTTSASSGAAPSARPLGPSLSALHWTSPAPFTTSPSTPLSIASLSSRPDPGPFLVPSYLRGSRFIRKLRASYLNTYPDCPVPPLSKLQPGPLRIRPAVVYHDSDLTDDDDDDEDTDQKDEHNFGDEDGDDDALNSSHISLRPYLTSTDTLAPTASTHLSWINRDFRYSPKSGRVDRPAHNQVSSSFIINAGPSASTDSLSDSPLHIPPIPLLPNRLSDTDKSGDVDFSQDGTAAAISTVPGSSSTSERHAVVLRSNHHIPRQCGIYYFEVSIAVNGTECVPFVGFADQSTPTSTIPGQADKSWGFNCFSGEICHSRSRVMLVPGHQSDTFTVGFGFNFRTYRVFLTRNASRTADFNVTGINTYHLHPVVGIQSPNGVRISFNFGQRPFMFDIDSVVAEETRTMKTAILASSLSSTRYSGSESELMRDLVMHHLLQAGYPETAKTLAGEIGRDARLSITGQATSLTQLSSQNQSESVVRKELIDFILDGRIKDALEIVEGRFPSMLQKEPLLYFKLRSRLFVEMVAETYSALNPIRDQSHSKPNGHLEGLNGLNGGCGDAAGDVKVEDGDSMVVDAPEPNRANLLRLVTMGQELRSQFGSVTDKDVSVLLTHTLGLMAYQNPWESPLAVLLDPSGRAGLADELNRAILKHLGLPPYTALEMMVRHTDAFVTVLDGHGKAGVSVDGLKDIQEPHWVRGRRAGM